MATTKQIDYIRSLVGAGVTVRGTRITSESKIERLTTAQASAMIDELTSLGCRPASRPTTSTFGSPTHCHFCGGSWAVSKVADMSGLPGYVCGHHARDFAEGLGHFA